MDGEQSPADSLRIERLALKFHSKEYRDTYVEAHSRRFLAHQMREFRGNESQTEFGQRLGKSQTIVSRLEDATYSGWTLHTLFEVAQRLNVAAIVRFVDFKTFLQFTDDVSDAALKPAPYQETVIDDFALEYAASQRATEWNFWPNSGIDGNLLFGGQTVYGATGASVTISLESLLSGGINATPGMASNIYWRDSEHAQENERLKQQLAEAIAENQRIKAAWLMSMGNTASLPVTGQQPVDRPANFQGLVI
jgi:hypothetical protein